MNVVFKAHIAGNLIAFSPSCTSFNSGLLPLRPNLPVLQELGIACGPDRHPVRETRLLDTIPTPLPVLRNLDLSG